MLIEDSHVHNPAKDKRHEDIKPCVGDSARFGSISFITDTNSGC